MASGRERSPFADRGLDRTAEPGRADSNSSLLSGAAVSRRRAETWAKVLYRR